MNNSCNITSSELEAYFDGNLFDDDRRSYLEAHVSVCPHCRAHIHVLTAMRHRFRNDVPLKEAPPYLQRDIEGILGMSRRSPMRPTFRGLLYAAAASMLIVLAVAVWNTSRPPYPTDETMPLTAFIADHSSYVRKHEDKEKLTGTIANLERWLTAELGFTPRLPRWESAALQSGRPCTIRGIQVALARYRIDGHDASLFMFPASRAHSSNQEQHLNMMRIREFHVATWTQHGLVYVFVAPEEVDHLCNRLALNAITPEDSLP